MSKVRVVVIGHGTFATGIEGALHLLVSVPKEWSFVNFAEGMSDDQLKTKLQQVIDTNSDPILFFTDLVGGTPYKVAATIAADNPRFAVVAGCNLGSLLESIFDNYTDPNKFAKDLVATSKKGTQVFTLDNLNNVTKNNSSDGI
jgi:PTS system N-acetylgalactosamine-specific IIA component